MRTGLGNDVSQVLENIVQNIETFLASDIVGRYLLAALSAGYLESKVPANIDFASNRQQCELQLDYVQFRCVVQLEELVGIMTRQQDERNLDSGWTTLEG